MNDILDEWMSSGKKDKKNDYEYDCGDRFEEIIDDDEPVEVEPPKPNPSKKQEKAKPTKLDNQEESKPANVKSKEDLKKKDDKQTVVPIDDTIEGK